MSGNALNNSAPIFDVDNLRLDGNTLSSTDTNGDIILAPDGTGDLSFNSAYTLPTADGAAGQVLSTDGLGGVSFSAPSAGAYTLIASGTGTGANEDVSLGAVYPMLMINISNFSGDISNSDLIVQFSDDDGVTIPTTGYQSGQTGNSWNSATIANVNSTAHINLIRRASGGKGSGTFFLTNGTFGSGNIPTLVGQGFQINYHSSSYGIYNVSGYGINFLRFSTRLGTIVTLSYAIYSIATS